jgi:hypothetical protein
MYKFRGRAANDEVGNVPKLPRPERPRDDVEPAPRGGTLVTRGSIYRHATATTPHN